MKRWLANEEGFENYTMERKRKKRRRKKKKTGGRGSTSFLTCTRTSQGTAVRVGHHLLLMCCIVLNILNLSHTFNSVIAQYGYCSTGSISNLCFSTSLMNSADAPTIAYTHRIQPLRYISSTARLLMSSTDVETFTTADIEEYLVYGFKYRIRWVWS